MALNNNQKNTWYKLINQNLAVFMREAGFDLSVYDSYSSKVQEEAKRKSILVAVNSLRKAFWDVTESELKDVVYGVYVIRLSGNMSVKYHLGDSPIIYIGEGVVESRLRGHYNSKLFDFMRSLNGVNFDFYICEPWKKNRQKKDFHQQIEFELIKNFAETFGGLNVGDSFPLMNKISGKNKHVPVSGDWWKRPLRKSNRKTNWILEPGQNSDFVGSLR